MQMNETGLKLLRDFEGCKLNAYLDVAGVWTIGYGHTRTAREGMTITKKAADALLARDLAEFERGVYAACSEEPNANQFAAMVSLAFNIGLAGFQRSTVLRRHNAGDFTNAAKAFSMWNKAGGQVRAGLTRRRAAEAALYLTPVDDHRQTTSSATVESADGKRVTPARVAASIGGALTIAQQAVAQASDIWDGLGSVGISPHLVLAVLGVATIGAVAWFVWQERRGSE
jgi:lysozyme